VNPLSEIVSSREMLRRTGSRSLFKHDAPKLIGAHIGKPEVAIPSCCNFYRPGIGRQQRKLGDRASGSNAPDPIPHSFSKPEIAIWSYSNPFRVKCCELGDRASGSNAPDPVSVNLGKPEVAIPSCDNCLRAAIRCGERELGDRASGSNAPDLVPIALGKPEIAIWSYSNPLGGAIRCRERELGDRAGRGNASNLVPIILSKPEIAIRPWSDPVRLAIRQRYRELGDRAGGGNASNLVPTILGKPEIAIRSNRNPFRTLLRVGSVNSVIVPSGVMRPIWSIGTVVLPDIDSVNQRLPSGPAVIPSGLLATIPPESLSGGTGIANSVIVPVGVAVAACTGWLLGLSPIEPIQALAEVERVLVASGVKPGVAAKEGVT